MLDFPSFRSVLVPTARGYVLSIGLDAKSVDLHFAAHSSSNPLLPLHVVRLECPGQGRSSRVQAIGFNTRVRRKRGSVSSPLGSPFTGDLWVTTLFGVYGWSLDVLCDCPIRSDSSYVTMVCVTMGSVLTNDMDDRSAELQNSACWVLLVGSCLLGPSLVLCCRCWACLPTRVQ